MPTATDAAGFEITPGAKVRHTGPSLRSMGAVSDPIGWMTVTNCDCETCAKGEHVLCSHKYGEWHVHAQRLQIKGKHSPRYYGTRQEG